MTVNIDEMAKDLLLQARGIEDPTKEQIEEQKKLIEVAIERLKEKGIADPTEDQIYDELMQ